MSLTFNGDRLATATYVASSDGGLNYRLKIGINIEVYRGVRFFMHMVFCKLLVYLFYFHLCVSFAAMYSRLVFCEHSYFEPPEVDLPRRHILVSLK